MNAGVIFVVASLFQLQPTEPATLAPLIQALHDADVETRQYAALAIAELGVVAVEPLKKALTDPDFRMRAGAAYALGQFGVRALPAQELLLKALKDDERDVRRQAAYAMSRILAAERGQVAPSSPVPAPAFPVEMPPK